MKYEKLKKVVESFESEEDSMEWRFTTGTKINAAIEIPDGNRYRQRELSKLRDDLFGYLPEEDVPSLRQLYLFGRLAYLFKPEDILKLSEVPFAHFKEVMSVVDHEERLSLLKRAQSEELSLPQFRNLVLESRQENGNRTDRTFYDSKVNVKAMASSVERCRAELLAKREVHRRLMKELSPESRASLAEIAQRTQEVFEELGDLFNELNAEFSEQ
ncbi:MAG: hypothetical protein K8U03_07725 [Planctomycetia bacterium]|nr:hypothetical protein [Planctomycetia bacterium]